MSNTLSRNRREPRMHSNRPPSCTEEIVLKVPLCCEDCEKNVRGQLNKLKSVKHVYIYFDSQEVVVIGYHDVKLEPSIVLNAVKKVKNRAELWKPSKNI